MRLFASLAFIFVLSPLLALDARAQSNPRVDEIVFFDVGYYEAGPSNTIQFVKASTEIVADLGVKFGFRYLLRGPDSVVPVQMLFVTRLPQRQGQVDPKTGQRRFRIEDTGTWRIGAPSGFGYSFDEPWEIVPGEWIVEVWIAGAKRAEQRFNIVRR